MPYYKTLTDEQLRAEIQRLEAIHRKDEQDYDREVDGTTFLDKCRRELALRGRLSE